MFRLVGKDSGYLFASRDLREIMDMRMNAMQQEVAQIEANQLLNTSVSDLKDYLVKKYNLATPELRRDAWTMEENEAQVDVRHDQNRMIQDRGRPTYVAGQSIAVEIPFEGEAELMYAHATTYTGSPPRARIAGQSIYLEFQVANDQQRDIRQEIETILKEIDVHLNWVRNDTAIFNQDLVYQAALAVDGRRIRLLENQGRVAALGISLKRRTDEQLTFAAPEVRRKVLPTLPVATSVAYAAEPVLDVENYEHILSVLQNMSLVIERSPSAFATMGEEDIRQHFLVQLNGQFEGAATGETFNKGGKTDILMRSGEKNIFIAECKFWKGPKHFDETIDQLLRYTAWRDTKTAILIFNRGTDTSTVLKRVDVRALAHRNFKRKSSWQHESGFRYVYHHDGDLNREFLLTVLVFDVPGSSS